MSANNNFEHLILTAFNIDLGIKDREKILNYEYLSQRFKLFKQFCFPSVRQQNNQNFKWLVIFDSETPVAFKDEINALATWDRFIPLYVEPVKNISNFWSNIAKQYLSHNTEFVITSNLDNDDSLSQTFVEIIQNNFHEQEFEFLNLPFGYMLRQDGLFLREFLSSPFISLIEKTDRISTCKIIDHNHLFEIYKKGVAVRQIITQPTWLQVVHETNVVNRMDINSVIQPINKVGDYFAVSIDTNQYNQDSYIKQLMVFGYKSLFINKYRQPLGLRIRKLLSAILPVSGRIYLTYSLRRQALTSQRCQLSTHDARILCQEYKQGG